MCLQEVWVGRDADLLISAAKDAGLEHAVHFRSVPCGGCWGEEYNLTIFSTVTYLKCVTINDTIYGLSPPPSLSLFPRSGIFGSGLVTLTRWPILDSSFHLYSAAGDALALHCGDYLAAKGVW